MRALLLCVFLVFGLAGCGGDRPAEKKLPETVSMDLRDRDVAWVLEQISERTVGNVVVDEDVNKRVTITLRKAPWRAAVRAIAERSECKVESIGDSTLRVYVPRR